MIKKSDGRPSLATPAEQRAMGGKQVCPACGHKAFVPYLDAERNLIGEGVGRCERINSCKYHYPPREYFEDCKSNGMAVPKFRQLRPVFEVLPTPTFIDPSKVEASVIDTMTKPNNLVDYLKKCFPKGDTVNEVVRKYFVGTYDHFNGAATVFWQIDRNGYVRRGKVMQYDPTSGKRVKVGKNGLINWVHKLENLGTAPTHCLFGEHLLSKYPYKKVGIVESEKTALIASCVSDECLWLACGSCQNLNPDMCQALRGRDVILFPDNDMFDKWSEKGKAMKHIFARLSISPVVKNQGFIDEGCDLADYLLLRIVDWRDPVSMVASNLDIMTEVRHKKFNGLAYLCSLPL